MFHRRLRAASTATLLFLTAAAPLAAHAGEPPAADGFAAELAALLPSVVEINTVVSSPQGNMYYYGSGFVIEPSGVILTNRHVIAGAYDITVTIPEIGQVKAKPLYISGQIDVALLKVDVGKPLPVMTLGDSRTVKVGDEVLLLGNPLGVGLSVSHGVVSALNRDIGESMYDHFIQTDGALNHGNSGGPLVNLKGEVIGIDTALDSSPGNTGSVGVGFAMPIDDAKLIIDQYLKTGRVVIGTVGVHAQQVTDDLAAAFGLGKARGLLVNFVNPAGPAEGRLRPGDVVLDVDGHPASDGRAVARMVASTPPGRTLTARVLRDGNIRTLTITVAKDEMSAKQAMHYLGHMPSMAMGFATPSNTGMTFAEKRTGTDPKDLTVKTVTPNSAAADRLIAPGDVILAVGDTPVRNPADLKRQLQAVVNAHRKYAPLLVQTGMGNRWVALPVERDH